MQTSDAPIETKSIGSDGIFTGYGAVFGNRDSHGDVIRAGAFRSTLAEWRAKGRWPAMKIMHGAAGQPFTNDDLPIGKWLEMREDATGLYVRGQILALNTEFGRRIHSLMGAGAVLDGLSIGYRVKRSSPGLGGVKRFIEAADLIELSVVDVPSNPLARVSYRSPQAAYDEASQKLQRALTVAAAAGPKPEDADSLASLARGIRALAR